MPEAMAAQAPVLVAGDFAAFYRAVHGNDPFPWQQDVVARVLADSAWPDLVDVPTGLGKTSMLDVAVFVAAATAGRHTAERLGRRRCFFVVDRRIVVDEAHEHALTILRALRATADGARDGDVPDAVARVRAALRTYAPDAPGDVLTVTKMRGGTTWDAAWLDRPDRPGLVLGTVDQVGSRLLFRGYGVSDRRRPIDAALVGTDALLMVDEAHLSTALLTTAGAAQDRDRLGVPLPGLDVIRLSATPGDGAELASRPYTLDLEAHRRHPEAGRRLTAGKRLTCVSSTAKDCVRMLADTALQRCHDLARALSPGHAPTALVVCNTVDRARAVHAVLVKELSARSARLSADCELLIGRSRPLDRPELQERLLARFGTGPRQGNGAAILVATQTVEVGINLDVDVLVTESASWDALVQRLGRLNRLGRFAERFPGQGPAAAVVIHDGQRDGPVYAAARDATWTALTELVETAGDDGLDVSPLGCRELSAGPLADPACTRRPSDVPLLLTPTLDAWVQTAPVPLNDPPIEPFLHGFSSGTAAVQVAWRDGLLVDDPLDDPFGEDPAEVEAGRAGALLAAVPVRTAELVEVPFSAVRQWMLGQSPAPVSDLEAEPEIETRSRSDRDPFRALAWRADTTGADERSGAASSWRWIVARDLRPGDVIIVPAEQGGLDEYGWSPTDRTRVRDVSEPATFEPSRSRGEAMLRLDDDLPTRLGLSESAAATYAEALAQLRVDEDARDTPTTDLVDALRDALSAGLPDTAPERSGWSRHAWAALRTWLERRPRLTEAVDHTLQVAAHGAEPPVLARLLAGHRPSVMQGREPGDVVERDIERDIIERDDEDVAASSLGVRRVTLVTHLDAVRARAARIAQALGLPDGLRQVVEDAAGWHDLGKVEPRFQVMLHGGDDLEAALSSEPLAKSGMDPADRLAARRARLRSGLPPGARHEAWSLALVDEYLRTRGADYPGDVDLLLHLVASHHGHARPFLPLVVDPAPRPVEALVDGQKVSVPSERTVSLDHPARFARLNHRYGRWGLALLEAVVRCADMTVSGEGS